MGKLIPAEAEKQKHRQELATFLTKAISQEVPEYLVVSALSEHVGVFFLHRLQEKGIEFQDSANLQAMRRKVQQYTVQNMLQEHAMLEVNQSLLDEAIKPIWLKGAVLSYTVYPEPHLRMKADLDVIVASEKFDQALDILINMGYKRLDKGLETVAQRLSHHEVLTHNKYDLVYFELHRRLLGHAGGEDIPSEILQRWIANPLEFKLNEQVFHTLQPENHLLYICAHAFLQHGESVITLRHLLDIHLLVTHSELNWQYILSETARLQWNFLLETALIRTQHYFETAIPNDVFDILRSRKSQDENISRIVLKGAANIIGESVLQVMSNLTLAERAKFVIQLVLPSKEYMQWRYDISEDDFIYPYYFYRWYYQAKGLLKAILRRIKFIFLPK